MNILITGGDSFIARSIKASPLFTDSEMFTIFAPSHKELDVAKSIWSYVIGNKIDFIIHTAVDTGEDTISFDNNVRILSNVIDCAPHVAGIVCFGSGVEYCSAYASEKNKEYYTAFKCLQSKYISCSGYDNIKIIDIFGAFGPLEDKDRFISYVVRRALRGEDIFIEQDRLFTYTHVEDIALAIHQYIYSGRDANNSRTLRIPYYCDHLLKIAYLVKKACDSVSPIIVTCTEEGTPYVYPARFFEYIRTITDQYIVHNIQDMIKKERACLTPQKE